MAVVRFKFRSSRTFDSVDIGAQSSISIRDLKSKIVLKNHLNLSQDFDLIFSDSLSGQEYKDENVRISAGSSMIIKRVPAKSNPSLRCSEEVLLRCQKFEATHPTSQSTRKGSSNEGSTLVMQSKPKSEEGIKLESTSPAKQMAVENSDMPSELKCYLCRTCFKEAVMIPCCQHSFCGKCIGSALAESSKCPMCSSTKCKPEDLLPNVSLRQAIERFLESQVLPHGLENDLHRYAPDGESGIQVKELSNATSPQRHFQLNQSATWNRPNQIPVNKFHDRAHAHGADTKYKLSTLEDSTEFQGENEPPNSTGVNEEANSCTKKVEGFHVISGGGGRNVTPYGRLNRSTRTCYMCGSPDHLIRDCPSAASSCTSNWNGAASLPGTVPGYAPPYWPAISPQVSPFANMYGSPGMMMYNTTVAPIMPFAFPSYAPSMYGGYPVPRERFFDRDHNANMLHDYSERGPYHSGDSFARRSEGKSRSHDHSDNDTYSNGKRHERISRPLEGGRDLRVSQSERLASGKDMPENMIRCREGRHEKHHTVSGRNNGSDSSHNHRHSNYGSMKKRRMEHHERKSDREICSHSGSSVEHSYSSGDAMQRREGSGPRSRHSKKSVELKGKELYHDQGKMDRYSDDDYREDYHKHQRKRFH